MQQDIHIFDLKGFKLPNTALWEWIMIAYSLWAHSHNTAIIYGCVTCATIWMFIVWIGAVVEVKPPDRSSVRHIVYPALIKASYWVLWTRDGI